MRSLFRRRQAEPAASPITGYEIVTEMPNGNVSTISGWVTDLGDEQDVLDYVAGIVDGLERKGFQSSVTLTRESREVLR